MATRDFELGEGTMHIYRKEMKTKKGKKYRSRYAACEEDAFQIIANAHSQLLHSGITKTTRVLRAVSTTASRSRM